MSRVGRTLEAFEAYILQLEQRISDLEGDHGYLDEGGFHPHDFVDRKALVGWGHTLNFIRHDNWSRGCRACGRYLGFNYECDQWVLADQRDRRQT